MEIVFNPKKIAGNPEELQTSFSEKVFQFVSTTAT